MSNSVAENFPSLTIGSSIIFIFDDAGFMYIKFDGKKVEFHSIRECSGVLYNL